MFFHRIHRYLWIIFLFCLLSGCSSPQKDAQSVEFFWDDLQKTGAVELQYAEAFSVGEYEGGYRLISIADGEQYLTVPEGAAVPGGIPEGVTVLQLPLRNLYMASTSSMDYYRHLDAMDCIRLSGLNENGWYLEEAKQAMARGDILYAGKYSAPDYERIYAEGCGLAVESTMIYHTPEVKEQLERLGIPVLIERSSYESHPLGRMEWIKLHGILVGKEAQAEAIFDDMCRRIEPILAEENTEHTVAFFAVSTSGYVTVRKSGDYVAKTIELAGGKYIFDNLGEDGTATSTVNLQMEAFFDGARDADILIYNSAINGELNTMEDLFSRSEVFRKFTAVQTGQVYCTGKNLFQEPMALGELIVEIHGILTEDETVQPDHLKKLR